MGVVRDFGKISTLGNACVDGTERGGPVEAGRVALLCGDDVGAGGRPVVGVAGGDGLTTIRERKRRVRVTMWVWCSAVMGFLPVSGQERRAGLTAATYAERLSDD